jgi:hypothetical protein
MLLVLVSMYSIQVFSQIIWFWGDNFLDRADAYSANYLGERFPFLERVELQIATGGEIAGYPEKGYEIDL